MEYHCVGSSRSFLYLIVWDAICLRPGSHRLVQSHSKIHHTASHLSAMVSFLLISNKLSSISSLAQHICQFNISDKTLFKVRIWETGTVFMLCQFRHLPIWTIHDWNICWKNSICFFQDLVLQNFYFGADEWTLATLRKVAIHLSLLALMVSPLPKNFDNFTDS